MVGVALLAITFGIYNATSLTLAERGWELGALRVLGFEIGGLRRFLYLRALLLVGAAYILGALIAVTYMTVQGQQTPIVIHGATLLMRVQPWALALGLCLTALFAYLGVWLPLAQQSRQSVAQAIRR
jgi:ABC-type antimicrobial peptide transport system permease subunit